MTSLQSECDGEWGGGGEVVGRWWGVGEVLACSVYCFLLGERELRSSVQQLQGCREDGVTKMDGGTHYRIGQCVCVCVFG